MYEGVDLLAEVFPGTESAPLPVLVRPTGAYGTALQLAPDWSDPRWRWDEFGMVVPAGTAEDGRLL